MGTVDIFKVNKNAITPNYSTFKSACFDLYACLKGESVVTAYNESNLLDSLLVEEDRVYIPKGYRVLIPTGIIFGIPENCVMNIYIRSGISFKKGLMLSNSVAKIDEDYPEQTYIILYNTSLVEVEIVHGDRIAQAEIDECKRVMFNEVGKNPVIKTNRISGLGSTGN